jgi:hypothetical protein
MTARTGTTDYYRLLGVSPHATLAEVRAAYRRKVRLSHPDLVANRGHDVRQAATEMTALLNEAYFCLSDRDRRAAYDHNSITPPKSAWETPRTHRDTTASPGRRTRRPTRRVRDLATVSLGGIVLPLLLLVWAMGVFGIPRASSSAVIAAICVGVIAATTWLLISSRLLRRTEDSTRIGAAWTQLMRGLGWTFIGGGVVVLGIPAVAGILTLIGVIASPILGLAFIALILSRFDSKGGEAHE